MVAQGVAHQYQSEPFQVLAQRYFEEALTKYLVRHGREGEAFHVRLCFREFCEQNKRQSYTSEDAFAIVKREYFPFMPHHIPADVYETIKHMVSCLTARKELWIPNVCQILFSTPPETDWRGKLGFVMGLPEQDQIFLTAEQYTSIVNSLEQLIERYVLHFGGIYNKV